LPVERLIERNVNDQPLAEEGRRADALGAVEELIGDDHVAGRVVLAQAADGAHRDQVLDAQLLEAINIGAARHLARHQAVPNTVARQEGYALAGECADDIGIARRAKGRGELHALDRLQPLHGIQPAPADHADSRLWHMMLLAQVR
jgi:hypothetical protein